MSHPLDDLISAQKNGQARGLPSICSAHPWALAAAMQEAAQHNAMLLVEATCNQVNPFGGYTGMTPADFVRYVDTIASQQRFPKSRLLLGGDHLGPSPWQDEPEASAMHKAVQMVRQYAQAGFVKLHLDASMRLGDDPAGQLPPQLSARRSATLAQAAEQAAVISWIAPRYVIGSEVPLPGGARQHEDRVQVTKPETVQQTLDATRQAFEQAGLAAAWERVMAVVVQPGLEFGDDFVLAFQARAARRLRRFIETEPCLVYEAHSTDYQSAVSLRALVKGHFAILKVGPALTFAFREAAFALSGIENELFPAQTRSNLVDVLDQVMLRHPQYWEKYYAGDESARRLKRKFSLSDRIRYYWTTPDVQTALERLLANLEQAPLPLTLISQYMPDLYQKVRRGSLPNAARAFLLERIRRVLRDYYQACGLSHNIQG